MPAPTLRAIAQRSCIRHVSLIDDLGPDVPYELVAPILRKIDNPAQLHQLETNSPHIADLNAELWKSFLRRDTQWSKDPVEPTNPRSWHKVYNKQVAEDRKKLERQEKDLKSRIAQMDKDRQDSTVAFIPQLVSTRNDKRSRASKIRAPIAQIKNDIKKLHGIRGASANTTSFSPDTRKQLHDRAISQIRTAPAAFMKREPVKVHPYTLEQQRKQQPNASPVHSSSFRIKPVTPQKRAQGEQFAAARRQQQQEIEEERRQRLLSIKNSSPAARTVTKVSGQASTTKPARSTPASTNKPPPATSFTSTADDSLDFWHKIDTKPATFSTAPAKDKVKTKPTPSKATALSPTGTATAKDPLTSAPSPAKSPPPSPIANTSSVLKRPAVKTSVFMPAKKRRIGG